MPAEGWDIQIKRRNTIPLMNTLTNAPIQLKITGAVLAIAALAAVLLAVVMTAGPTMAHHNDPDVPKACGPEDSVQTPAEVFDSGNLLLFDGFWDQHNKLLHNNLCPAKIVYTEQSDGGFPPQTITVETLTATDIDVNKTVIQIDETYKHTLTQADIDKYPFLNDPDETGVRVNSDIWWLRLDDPTTTDTDEGSELKIGFSTGRLGATDWGLKVNDVAVEPFQYHFIAVREEEVPEYQHGHVYAFNPIDTGTLRQALWDSTAADTREMKMWPAHTEIDGVTQPTNSFTEWVFTKPGTYILEVHLKGNVNQDPESGISEHTVETSEAVRYTFHVGPLIDLGVELTGTLTGPGEGETGNGSVSYTVTASNSGLDTATGPVVQVNLPEGLEFVHDDTPNTKVFHNNGTVTWDTGALAAPLPGASPVTSTLTFSAAVTAAGAGQKLTAGAEIRDLTYNEVDRDHSNNTASATVTPSNITMNRSPLWSVERSVAENAPQGTAVGTPAAARDADMDTLVYSLSGLGADKFAVDANGQITVAADARLDYETKWYYQLTLHVSDGKAADNTAEAPATIDRDMAVNISLEDIDETTTLTLAGSVSTTTGNEPQTVVTVTATAAYLPDGYTDLGFTLSERDPLGDWTTESVAPGSGGTSGSLERRASGGAGTYHYTGFASFTTAEGHSVTLYAHPINVEVTFPE